MRGSPVGEGFPQSGPGHPSTLTRSCQAANKVLRVASVGCGTDCSVMNAFDRNASAAGVTAVDGSDGWSYGYMAVPVIGMALPNVAPKSDEVVSHIAAGLSAVPNTRHPM